MLSDKSNKMQMFSTLPWLLSRYVQSPLVQVPHQAEEHEENICGVDMVLNDTRMCR